MCAYKKICSKYISQQGRGPSKCYSGTCDKSLSSTHNRQPAKPFAEGSGARSLGSRAETAFSTHTHTDSTEEEDERSLAQSVINGVIWIDCDKEEMKDIVVERIMWKPQTKNRTFHGDKEMYLELNSDQIFNHPSTHLSWAPLPYMIWAPGSPLSRAFENSLKTQHSKIPSCLISMIRQDSLLRWAICAHRTCPKIVTTVHINLPWWYKDFWTQTLQIHF